MTATEAKGYKEKIEATAIKQMEDNAKTEIREFASGMQQEAIKRIGAEQSIRKQGDSKDFPLVSNEELLKARKLAEATVGSNINKTSKAYIEQRNEESSQIVDSLINGDTVPASDIKDISDITINLQNRQATQDMDSGNDDVFFDAKNDLYAGTPKDDYGILQLSEVLSIDQISELVEINEENKKLLPHKQFLSSSVSSINSQFNKLERDFVSSAGDNETAAKTSVFLKEEKESLIQDVRKGLAKDVSKVDIQKMVLARTANTNDGILSSGWWRWALPKKHEFLDKLEYGIGIAPAKLKRRRRQALVNLIGGDNEAAIEAAIDMGWMDE